MRFHLFLLIPVILVAGCASRSADDRVNRAPLRPAVAGYDPGYMVVAQVPAQKYRMSGNTVYVGTSQRAAYILPGNAVEDGSASQALANTDARLEAYLAAIEMQVDQVRQQGNQTSTAKEAPTLKSPERFLRRTESEQDLIDEAMQDGKP